MISTLSIKEKVNVPSYKKSCTKTQLSKKKQRIENGKKLSEFEVLETTLSNFGAYKLKAVPKNNAIIIRQNVIRNAAPIVYFAPTNMMKNKSLPLGSVPNGGWTSGVYGDFNN